MSPHPTHQTRVEKLSTAESKHLGVWVSDVGPPQRYRPAACRQGFGYICPPHKPDTLSPIPGKVLNAKKYCLTSKVLIRKAIKIYFTRVSVKCQRGFYELKTNKQTKAHKGPQKVFFPNVRFLFTSPLHVDFS